MNFYKFTQSRFVESASFRFGTLYDFRREEKYGPQVGDKSEGSSRSVQETFHYWADFNPHAILASQPFEYAYAKGMETDGLRRHVLSVTSQDLLVYCVTECFEEKLYDAFDADVCLKIVDWPGFTSALVHALPVRVEKYASSSCSYLEKDIFATSKSLPSFAFWKEPRYAHQKEHRLCVSVAADPISPVTIHSPNALSFCRVLKR